MATVIRFGTDGWRAVIAEDFTFENVRACAQGVADYLHETGLAGRGLVVGYDTRFHSEHFAAAVAEVATANGIHTWLCDRPAPTPVVSYNIVSHRAGGAVVITASHNPGVWNGFKFKPEYAGSASTEVVERLEQFIQSAQSSGRVRSTTLAEAKRKGHVELLQAAKDYLSHLEGLVDLQALQQAGLLVAVDSMFGAGAGYFRRLLQGGNTKLVELHATRNPLFPSLERPEPITQNLKALSSLVVRRKANVGLATDGDADRLGVLDEKGQFITQLQTFALLALYLLEVRQQRGAIVKSVTTSQMLHKLGKLYSVPVYELPVGFKHIGPVMMKEKALIGGEESGGYGFRGHIPERDGVLSGLYLLDFMVKTRKTPSQLLQFLFDKVGPHHYNRIDLELAPEKKPVIQERVANARPEELGGVAVEGIDTIDGFRFVLKDGSWLMVRFSGTEPLLRIYGESESPQRVEALLQAGRKLTGL
jgi:alpha-D-glucose phosphate-specific phosphoglucomutase